MIERAVSEAWLRERPLVQPWQRYRIEISSIEWLCPLVRRAWFQSLGCFVGFAIVGGLLAIAWVRGGLSTSQYAGFLVGILMVGLMSAGIVAMINRRRIRAVKERGELLRRVDGALLLRSSERLPLDQVDRLSACRARVRNQHGNDLRWYGHAFAVLRDGSRVHIGSWIGGVNPLRTCLAAFAAAEGLDFEETRIPDSERVDSGVAGEIYNREVFG